MRQSFTASLKPLLLALALGTGATAQGQIIPQPVAVTGFNADIVANGTGNTTAGTSSNSSVDANSYVFLSNDYTTTTAPGFFHPNVGLPYGQTFLGAATPNVLYRLPSYAANNSLRLYGVGGTTTPATTATGTLTFTTPAPAGTLYVLATSGSGSDATTAQVNFADGTNQVFTFTVQDWFNNTPYAYSVNNRVLVTGTNFDAIIANTTTPNPRLYQYALTLLAANAGKNIMGITFTKSTSAGTYVQIMAVSAAPATTNNYTPVTLTFPATGAPAVYSGTAFTTPSVSGQDVIANGTTGNTITAGTTTTPYTNTSATADTDGAGYFLMATDYNSATSAHPTNGLPVAGVNSVTTTGLLSSLATTGLSYQLADYSGINALQIRGVGSGSVSFATAAAATEVYVLTTSTNSTTSTGTMTVTFADGSTHAYAVNFNNWFNTPTSANSTTLSNATTSIGVYTRGRLQPGNTVQTSTTTPYLFENKLVLSPGEYGKPIASITVENTSTSNSVSVLAVTLNANSASVTQCTTPAGHTTTASVATACAATSFSLNVLGLPAVAGYTYQWQSSPDNATWTNLPTATTASPYSPNPTSAACTVLNQSAATYYRCVVQCGFTTGAGVPSASVQVGQTDPINCYSYPATSTSGCTTYGSVTAVQIAETATPANVVLNKTGLSCATTTEPYATYGIYRDAPANGTLDKSKDYTLTVTVANASRLGVWLDLNQDGVYNATTNSTTLPSGEYFGTTTTTAAGTLTLAIPAAALATVTNGVVGMRVRTERNTTTVLSTASNSNATTGYGVTLDYAVIVTGATPCAGTPATTAPTVSSSAACPGSLITLTANGPAVGTTGLTYQWQYKLSSATAYAPVPATITDVNGVAVATNSTTATLTITNQRAATDYQVVIACANGGASATSPAATITQSPIATCYCQNSNNATNEYLTNVTLGTLNNTSGSSQGNTPTGFIDYTASPTATQTTTLIRGTAYTLSVAGLSASTAPTEMVWIDYDQSGTFDANEYTLIGTQSTTGAVTGSVSLTIPATALLGDTRMRVRFHNDATGTGASACTNGWNGETEDYRVTIAPTVACTGTPPAITIAATATSVCSGTSFTLTAAGPAAGTTGLSYQWQSKLATATTFANLGTAQTTPTYTVASQSAATDYRVVVTCTASNLSATSNVVSVGQTAFANCYCAVISTGTNEYIKSVTLPGAPGFTNASGANSTNGYGNFTATTGTTTTLARNTTYPNVSVTVRANSTGSQGGLWIDYDQNGVFDASEYTLVGNSSATATDVTFPVTLVVPATALAGPTRLRVRWRNSAFTAADACVSNTAAGCTTGCNWFGETEDYLVTISATPLATNSASAAAKLALFPNPAQATTTLLGAEAGATVQVLDMLSRVVLTVKADASGKATLPLPAGTAKGVYLVRAGQQTARLVLE